MAEDLRCPVCDAKGKKYKIKTLRGWKTHMHEYHGEITEDQLRTAIGDGPGEATQTSGFNSREEFRSTLGETESDAPATIPVEISGESSGPSASGTPPVAMPSSPRSKRVKATPKKLRKLVAQIPQTFLATKGITLDDEDNAALEEAIGFIEDVFGFEFEVPESSYVVQSRWLALFWPIAVVIFIFVKHKSKEIFEAKPDETNPENSKA